VNLIGSYNYALVALSVLIAIVASYAALDLAARVTAAVGSTRSVWLLGGAGAMGTGIWSMHYLGMLAFVLPISVAYHWPTVLLSLLAAILASVIALHVVSRQHMSVSRVVAGSVLMGAGIAGMHYTGMAATRLAAVSHFNSVLVVLSVVLAVLISFVALSIVFQFRNEKAGLGWGKSAGAIVMGSAIPVMHYTGMAAASFTPSSVPADLSHAVSISLVGTTAIAVVTFLILGLALLTSWMDRRFAERKLERSEAYLAEAQRLSHTGSFGWRPSTGELIWSAETFRIFQYDRTMTPTVELILQRVHPADAPSVRETIERASQDGRDFEHEYRLVMPDGAVRHVDVVAHALSDQPTRIEFVGAVMDVSDRKRAEGELRRSEGYLAEAQRLTHTGIWAWSVTARRSVYWSRENYRLFAFAPEDGIPSDEAFYQRVHPEDRERVRREVFLERPDEGSHFDVQFRLVLPDGAMKYVRSTGHAVRSISGDVLEYVGTSIDVTDRKRAEEERERLRQAQEDLAHVNRVTTMGELTASLAHEVSQPITAAVTDANACVRWLTRDSPDVEEARAAASRVVQDAMRAADIVSRIRLLFTKTTPPRELIDLNEVIRGMVALLRGEATRYSVSIRTDLAAPPPFVVGDRVQLQQVMMNLIMNGTDAMKDMEGTRELAIKSQPAGHEECLVSVSDTGVGLPAQQADQIFNAFFTTKPHGTGMGLSISRSIVESHGGRLWAGRNSPRGASFYFTLPSKLRVPDKATVPA